MEIKSFGEIDINELEEYYESSIQIQGDTVEVDLNFEMNSIDYGKDKNSKTNQYLQHHLVSLGKERTVRVFGTKDITKKVFLDHLNLCRIGLYPEDDESYAIFDIQLPKNYTNYLLAITFDKKGNISDMSIES